MSAQQNEVVEVADYLRETLAEMDEAIVDTRRRRHELAVRLAVLDAAGDPELQRVADEVQERIDAGDTFPDARPAQDVLAEAHRRYVR